SPRPRPWRSSGPAAPTHRIRRWTAASKAEQGRDRPGGDPGRVSRRETGAESRPALRRSDRDISGTPLASSPYAGPDGPAEPGRAVARARWPGTSPAGRTAPTARGRAGAGSAVGPARLRPDTPVAVGSRHPGAGRRSRRVVAVGDQRRLRLAPGGHR